MEAIRVGGAQAPAGGPQAAPQHTGEESDRNYLVNTIAERLKQMYGDIKEPTQPLAESPVLGQKKRTFGPACLKTEQPASPAQLTASQVANLLKNGFATLANRVGWKDAIACHYCSGPDLVTGLLFDAQHMTASDYKYSYQSVGKGMEIFGDLAGRGVWALRLHALREQYADDFASLLRVEAFEWKRFSDGTLDPHHWATVICKQTEGQSLLVVLQLCGIPDHWYSNGQWYETLTSHGLLSVEHLRQPVDVYLQEFTLEQGAKKFGDVLVKHQLFTVTDPLREQVKTLILDRARECKDGFPGLVHCNEPRELCQKYVDYPGLVSSTVREAFSTFWNEREKLQNKSNATNSTSSAAEKADLKNQVIDLYSALEKAVRADGLM